MAASWLIQLVTKNHRQEDTKHKQEDIACLRKVIRRRLANGEFKGKSIFSEERRTQEYIFTLLRSIAKCLPRGRETLQRWREMLGHREAVFRGNLLPPRRGRKLVPMNVKFYFVDILLFFALANIKGYWDSEFQGWRECRELLHGQQRQHRTEPACSFIGR